MNRKILWVVTAVWTLFSACEIDHGLGIIESRITGKVIYLHPELKPARVDAVRVVAVVNFPPQGLGDLVITNKSISLSDPAPDYHLPAPLSHYVLVGAIYREKGKEWDYGNILGLYGVNPDSGRFTPRSVTLTKETPVVENVDIFCDWANISWSSR